MLPNFQAKSTPFSADHAMTRNPTPEQRAALKISDDQVALPPRVSLMSPSRVKKLSRTLTIVGSDRSCFSSAVCPSQDSLCPWSNENPTFYHNLTRNISIETKALLLCSSKKSPKQVMWSLRWLSTQFRRSLQTCSFLRCEPDIIVRKAGKVPGLATPLQRVFLIELKVTPQRLAKRRSGVTLTSSVSSESQKMEPDLRDSRLRVCRHTSVRLFGMKLTTCSAIT